jgi:hypothetical protein
MQVKIQSCTRDLKPLRDAPDGPLYTGLKINDKWYNIEGDHRDLYNKVVDLELLGNRARFATTQTPPAAPQTPPRVAPPASSGHTPRWPNRESAVEAYIYYAQQVAPYIQDPLAIARAANCLMMAERDGEINPVHRDEPAPFKNAV